MGLSDLNRRDFIRGLVAAPLIGVSAISAYARLVEPYRYLVSQITVEIRDLPDSFQGFRITQLTDIHHSRILGLDEIRRMVNVAQRTRPDMFVLTGDYSTSYRRYIEPCAEVLATLQAREGVWAVLGNHDHYTDPELTTRALQSNRINVLNNLNTALRRNTDRIQLAGVDDWTWGASDWNRTFKGLDKTTPTILLSHQPRVLDFPETENVSLVLSGHTHGGQIDLPVIGPPARFLTKDLKYARGLFRRENTQLYVSSGTGVIGLPVRFGVQPEIAVITLQRSQDSR